MASEIERLPDLQGFLKFASIPDRRRLSRSHVSYPTIDRPNHKGARKLRGSAAESSDAPSEVAEVPGGMAENEHTDSILRPIAEKPRDEANLYQ